METACSVFLACRLDFQGADEIEVIVFGAVTEVCFTTGVGEGVVVDTGTLV